MDNAVQLLKLLRGGPKNGKTTGGIRIIKAVTTDPNPITFVFEGTSVALDLAIFEVPVNLYPICKNDKFLASPLIGDNMNRWGVTSCISRGYIVGTMTSATQCQVEGIGRAYTSADLILPSFVPADGAVRPLKAGDTVSLLPVNTGGKIKYIVTYCF